LTLTAYLGDPALKDRVLTGLAAHAAAEELVRGVYFEQGVDDGKVRACSIGCTLHDLNPQLPANDHARFVSELGIPAQIAHLIDAIFEAQPDNTAAAAWSQRIMAAIPVGADLTGVWDRYALWMLDGLVADGHDPDGVVSNMAGLFRRAVNGDNPDEREWDRAARAAWAAWAAWDARDAGDAGDAWAARAAWAARDARDARNAGDAWAALAAESTDQLVKLVSEAPMAVNATIDTLGHGYFNGVGLEFEDDLESGCRQCSGTGFILGRRGLLCPNPIHITKGEA
jgi:hypothetical protein